MTPNKPDPTNGDETTIDSFATEITKYEYNDEYEYFNDWKDGVTPIIRKNVSAILRSHHLALLEQIQEWATEFTTYDGHAGIKEITLTDLRAKIEELKKQP